MKDDPVGRRFGRFVVLALAGHTDTKAPKVLVSVRCDCGVVKIARLEKLRSGHTASCGCLRRDVSSQVHGTHRASHTPEYGIWQGIIKRCENPAAHAFSNYGGRGIVVCERWRESFADFLADMGLRPSPRHSIDRIDVNGNYEPGNCRWATEEEQARNRRSTVLIDDGEERLVMADMAAKHGLSFDALRNRIRRGWDLQRALATPELRT